MAEEQKKSKYSEKHPHGPFKYSPTYYHWRGIAREKGACDPQAKALACQHAKTFGVYRCDCHPGECKNEHEED